MTEFFYPNQELILSELANHLELTSNKFVVLQKFDGGMGSCYRIEDFRGISYALKIIHSDLLLNDNALLRYNEELKQWLTFSACDGVAEAKCIIKINNIPCVVSTWMDRGDMNSIIKNMDSAVFFKSMERIIVSLKWVYEKYHIIHRDLKPGNILIDKNDNVYVSDWGLAKLINSQQTISNTKSKEIAGINPHLTQQGSFIGTVLYASPEQLLGLPNIDHRSDIYSLGCIMYQWETGHPPFIAKTINEIASAHLYTKPKKLGGLLKSTNFKVESIIMKCLEKEPKKRYQSYSELLNDFRKLAYKNVASFKPYEVSERYLAVSIGYDEFVSKLRHGQLGAINCKGYGIIEQEDVIPYLKEALILSNLGDYNKAISIYIKLFDKGIVEKMPDFGFNQHIVINLANSLNNIGKNREALDTILTISQAIYKPDTYYVNLSNIYISLLDFSKCINACEDGLIKYPNDPDLIGNYTIGLAQIGRLSEALKNAENRLQLCRDISAICEAANIMYKYAEELKNSKFPVAIDYYKSSLKLYREALQINPRYLNALYNIELLLFKMKRYSDAMDFGSEISKLEKGTSEVNAFYFVRNLFWTSNFVEALKFSNNWLKSYPESTLLKRVRAEILVDGYVIDNYTKDGYPIVERSSLDFFTNIIKDNSKYIASDVIFLAKIHCWMNEPEEIDFGLKLLEWGKNKFPKNWKFNFYLAAFALKYKLTEKALQEAKECVLKAPWRETAYSMLAEAYAANNDKSSSDYMLKEYQRIKSEKVALYDGCKNL